MKVENLIALPSWSIFIKMASTINPLALRHLNKMEKLRGNIGVLQTWVLLCHNMPIYHKDSGLIVSQLLFFYRTSCPHQPWIWNFHILSFMGNTLTTVCFAPLVKGASLILEIIRPTSWNPSHYSVCLLDTTLNIKSTIVSAPQLVMSIPLGMWSLMRLCCRIAHQLSFMAPPPYIVNCPPSPI